MTYQYTPAAERALHAAAGRLPRGETELTPFYALLGLLSEPECRAAKILEAQAIDEGVIRARWPDAEVRDTAKPGVAGSLRPLSHELENAFHGAILLLDENPRTCQLATEHLLLGLATDAGDVGSWLCDRGVNPDAMVAEICARYGIDHSPIPLAEVELGNTLTMELDNASIPIGSMPSATFPTASTLAIDDPAAVLSVVPRSATMALGALATDMRLVRILDAAANRAGEALRVVEDYVRFGLDDRALTSLCKQLRHELTAALAPLPMKARLAARDTVHDVGTDVSTKAEMTRADLADVAAANVRRLQESLRSLEEFGKVLDPGLAARCEQLRYRSYTLQQQLEGRAAATHHEAYSAPRLTKVDSLRDRLAAAKLYVLLDGRESEEAFVALAHSLITAGVDVLQLRDKHLDDRSLLSRARALRELTQTVCWTDHDKGNRHTLFIMNDRPDLAVLADADGVHIGQDELTVDDARRILGPARLIGVSTHSIEQARQAVADGADYLGLGPTFPSTTKQFTDFPGLALLRAAAQEIHLPAFAIGGITANNLFEVREAGIHRVALSGAILSAIEPRSAVVTIRVRLS